MYYLEKKPRNNTSAKQQMYSQRLSISPTIQVRQYILGTAGELRMNSVVVMPQTILPRRNRRCALSATDMRKPEEKDASGVTCFMEENVISPREVLRFNEHIRN